MQRLAEKQVEIAALGAEIDRLRAEAAACRADVAEFKLALQSLLARNAPAERAAMSALAPQ